MTFMLDGENLARKDHQSRKTLVCVCECVKQVSATNWSDCASLLSHCQKKIYSGLSVNRRPISSLLHPLVQRNVNICLAFCVKDMKF